MQVVATNVYCCTCFKYPLAFAELSLLSSAVDDPRRVAKVSIGVFVEPQILMSAGGTLTRGFRGHAPSD